MLKVSSDLSAGQRKAIENVAIQIANVKNLRVTLNQCVKGGAITGLCTLAGGLLGGKSGLLLGGTVGTMLAGYMAEEFKPVATVIREDMTPEQRLELVKAIGGVLLAMSVAPCLSKILNNFKVLSQVVALIKQSMQLMGYQMAPAQC